MHKFAVLFMIFVVSGCFWSSRAPETIRILGETMGTTYRVTVVDAPDTLTQENLSEGITATPTEATAAQGPGDSDTQPRQFWVDIEGAIPYDELGLTLHYYGCTPDMCMALAHEYTVLLEDENRGSRTFGMNRGPRGRRPSN